MFQVVLQKNAALGNGDRQRGCVLGAADGLSPAELVERVQETPTKSVSQVQLPEGASLMAADGVDDGELLTALRNGEMVAFVEPESEVVAESETEIEAEDMPAFPEAGDPSPPANHAKRSGRRKA
jgi:hypothetical protein